MHGRAGLRLLHRPVALLHGAGTGCGGSWLAGWPPTRPRLEHGVERLDPQRAQRPPALALLLCRHRRLAHLHRHAQPQRRLACLPA